MGNPARLGKCILSQRCTCCIKFELADVLMFVWIVSASTSVIVSWDPPRYTTNYQTINHEMDAHSDVHTPQRHQNSTDIDATVTQYINADLLVEKGRFLPNQQEIELRKLATCEGGVAVEPMEHDSMTVATRSTGPVDWTSPDSSFGAAFPCCGCIPKKTRRVIELCLIAIGSFLFIYIIMKFSVLITSGLHKNGQSSTNTTSGGSKYLETDDDFYVIDNEFDDNYFFWR